MTSLLGKGLDSLFEALKAFVEGLVLSFQSVASSSRSRQLNATSRNPNKWANQKLRHTRVYQNGAISSPVFNLQALESLIPN